MVFHHCKSEWPQIVQRDCIHICSRFNQQTSGIQTSRKTSYMKWSSTLNTTPFQLPLIFISGVQFFMAVQNLHHLLDIVLFSEIMQRPPCYFLIWFLRHDGLLIESRFFWQCRYPSLRLTTFRRASFFFCLFSWEFHPRRTNSFGIFDADKSRRARETASEEEA